MRRLLLACLLLLPGCANWLALPLLKIPPASLGPARTVEQRVSFERKDERRSFDAVFDLSASRLELVASAVGVRLFTLSYDGRTLSRGAGLPMPGRLPPEWVINDLLYVFAPADVLQSALPGGWLVLDAEDRREILDAGKTVISIGYTGEDRWNGHAQLEQRRLGYRLNIDSRELE